MINTFKIISFLEGISYILLLFVGAIYTNREMFSNLSEEDTEPVAEAAKPTSSKKKKVKKKKVIKKKKYKLLQKQLHLQMVYKTGIR